jgi:hypothetical protein
MASAVASDLTGQINLLAAHTLPWRERPASVDWSHAIADIIIGAPVGTSGNWFVRGAVAAGTTSAWTLFGEYQSHADQRHAVRLALSYSTHDRRDLPLSVVVPDSRSVGGLRVTDRWQLGPALEIDYGIRFERYDYLARPNLFSPRVGARAGLGRATFLTGSVSQSMIAPGSDQFLPPAASGPWLPPTRTFSSLAPGRALRPEQVRRQAIGIEREFGPADDGLVQVEVFAQSTVNQLATLFGLDPGRDVGHYHVASTGDVDVFGWRFRLAGGLSEHVDASVEYASGQARWSGTRVAGVLRRQAPSVARRGREHVSELRAGLDIDVALTATEILFAYRVNTARPKDVTSSQQPIASDGLTLQLRQRLPYQPLYHASLTLLFTFDTLLHDDEAGSIYDELLTVRAPARLTSGIRVAF